MVTISAVVIEHRGTVAWAGGRGSPASVRRRYDWLAGDAQQQSNPCRSAPEPRIGLGRTVRSFTTNGRVVAAGGSWMGSCVGFCQLRTLATRRHPPFAGAYKQCNLVVELPAGRAESPPFLRQRWCRRRPAKSRNCSISIFHFGEASKPFTCEFLGEGKPCNVPTEDNFFILQRVLPLSPLCRASQVRKPTRRIPSP
jgi:hypothetical protein